MPLSTGQLVDDLDVDPVYLMRWHNRGWVRGVPHFQGGRGPARGRGPGFPMAWPSWTRRMVAMLLATGGAPTSMESGGGAHSALMSTTADALAEWPDVPWLVWIEGQDRMAPAWTTADAVETAMGQPGPLRTIVSPPP